MNTQYFFRMPPGLTGAGAYGTFMMKMTQRGCVNRPFYHIVVIKSTYPNSRHIPPLEQVDSSLLAPNLLVLQVGTFDPLPNNHNEKLVSLNLERIQHFLAGGVHVDTSVGEFCSCCQTSASQRKAHKGALEANSRPGGYQAYCIFLM